LDAAMLSYERLMLLVYLTAPAMVWALSSWMN
jgi:hypothetical protein